MRSLKQSIFTDTELEAMAKRLKGDYTDPTGIYANRVRPKLKEIRAWHTPAMSKRLHSLLKTQRKVREEEPAQPNEEKTLNEFQQTIGY
jgi:hypothetical protein